MINWQRNSRSCNIFWKCLLIYKWEEEKKYQLIIKWIDLIWVYNNFFKYLFTAAFSAAAIFCSFLRTQMLNCLCSAKSNGLWTFSPSTFPLKDFSRIVLVFSLDPMFASMNAKCKSESKKFMCHSSLQNLPICRIYRLNIN